MGGPQRKYSIGVDVGTSSARAALFDWDGHIKATVARSLQTCKPRPGYYEQSSEDIWIACCEAVQGAIASAGDISVQDIKGIGFDATCSLVALDEGFQPVSISPSKATQWNVIMWMDHRAEAEAEEMSATGHTVLQRTGGKISPEMSAAKIVWLYRHMPEAYKTATTLMELPDFLTFKATGNPARSLNSLACKWTFAEGDGFNDSFWRAVGMDDLVDTKYARCLGSQKVTGVGEALVNGLTEAAAEQMGLADCAGMPVGAAVIDAYAGAIGTLGVTLDGETAPEVHSVQNRMAAICGTSSCHIALSAKHNFVPGVWGPYTNILLPDFHVAEGGQSITGALLTYIIRTHPAYSLVDASTSSSSFVQLNEKIALLSESQSLRFSAMMTKDMHLTPDFHGNRSPLADPTLRGVLVGCEMDVSLDALARTYYAALLALGYGTRQIIDTLNSNGYTVDTLFLSGGMVQNDLFVKSLADTTGCTVVLPRETDAVLLGAAILGAAAAEGGTDRNALWKAMVRMSSAGRVIKPCTGSEAEFHQKKYEVFKEIYSFQKKAKHIMAA
ncbi:FGGY carbohydrate kinase domain-containing protein [Fimicolochytrium jonesii]|uniref:FGGY carbohydrate kinase domain-containing protein n=1 Tax=Fimicolochytrium jonesii TaxID=1396493 RepID=UPI0022FE505E|nr:FGGY carbohydrate kinase domain-containing protein [Fimicolochytrium jonesii]KAI8818564.1 FGGY carbohydrate kinase domain-containing protein [Fimicolochytrium jonesii]